ncbi:magnesium transporter [Coniella lustricola]|uniref:Magnesium transporter n=1 Tax=Coniella lustricola TaxID=2025994 RepID=A0A2T3A2I2_9PEZI|nr:magnesium transporter [Coniella lustricola]
MTWLSKTTTTLGFILVAHACYSAQEHSALQSLRATSTTVHITQPSTSLPVDISIETVVGLFLTVLGLVADMPTLRPIQWRAWAGKVEREGEQGFLKSNGDVETDFVGNPFRILETRPGFVDIRSQRKEFAEWVRNGGKS